jgi:hypothetical protein
MKDLRAFKPLEFLKFKLIFNFIIRIWILHKVYSTEDLKHLNLTTSCLQKTMIAHEFLKVEKFQKNSQKIQGFFGIANKECF